MNSTESIGAGERPAGSKSARGGLGTVVGASARRAAPGQQALFHNRR